MTSRGKDWVMLTNLLYPSFKKRLDTDLPCGLGLLSPRLSITKGSVTYRVYLYIWDQPLDVKDSLGFEHQAKGLWTFTVQCVSNLTFKK